MYCSRLLAGRLPAASTLEGWVNATRPGFLFAPKAHQRITHIGRLKQAGEFTGLFLKSIDPLRVTRRLGPVLFQLPPNLKCDLELLEEFLAGLPPDLRYSFEFRHESWLTDQTYKLLAKHNVALCVAESEKLEIAVASDASREKLIEKKTNHHDRTSLQPAQPDSLDAQQNLPTHCGQDFNHAVAKPAEYQPHAVGLLQSDCNLRSLLWIVKDVPQTGCRHQQLEQQNADAFHGRIFLNER